MKKTLKGSLTGARLSAIALVLSLSMCIADAAALTCSISAPKPAEITQGEYLMLAAIVSDADAACSGNTTYLWYSSIDGFIEDGGGMLQNNLSVGRHTIELRYSDSCGASCKTSTQVLIKPVRLGAYLSNPESGHNYLPEEDIMFDCTVSGGKPPYTYLWKLDGKQLGEEKTFKKNLPPGAYKATLVVRESGGTESKDETTFYVISEPELPEIIIDSPGQYQTFSDESGLINFSATVSGGKKPYSYKWVMGNTVLSKAKDFLLKDFQKYINGSYAQVILEVTDSEGKTSSSNVFVRRDPVCNLNSACEGNENFLNCPKDCPSGSQDGLCDKVSDGKCDPDCSFGKDPDCVCNGDNVCDIGREDNVRCPLECAPGSMDGVCDAVSDGKCDPDCASGRDPDCKDNGWMNYGIVFMFILFALALYGIIKKRM